METPLISQVLEKLHSIDLTLTRQEGHLAEHIRRTQLLEEAMKPLQRHATMVEGAMKLIGLLAVIAGIVYDLHFLSH